MRHVCLDEQITGRRNCRKQKLAQAMRFIKLEVFAVTLWKYRRKSLFEAYWFLLSGGDTEMTKQMQRTDFLIHFLIQYIHPDQLNPKALGETVY